MTTSGGGAYDEARGPGGGLRPAPAAYAARTGRDPDDDRVVWVLGDHELRALRRGAAQRARALRDLFFDIVVEGADDNIATDTVEGAARRAGWTVDGLRELWRGRARSDVRFVHAVDAIRGPDGGFRAIEDNVGCLGGLAGPGAVMAGGGAGATVSGGLSGGAEDLVIALERFVASCRSRVAEPQILAHAGEPAAGRDRLLDPELVARRTAMASLGLVDGIERLHPDDVDGVIDLGGTVAARRPELLAAFRRGAPWLNGPGTALLGDKALLVHLDTLVGVDRLLPTASTWRPGGGEPPAVGPTVTKPTGGSGGEGVCFGGPDRSRAVGDVVVQDLIEPSRIAPAAGPALRLELRLFCWVIDETAVRAARHTAGRATLSGADRRANPSRGGLSIPVVEEPVSGPA